MKPDDESQPSPIQDMDSENVEPSIPPDPDRDRRRFLLRLGTMTFLTLAVFKGEVPAEAKPQDDGGGGCGVPSQGQAVHKDEDCVPSPAASGNQDIDCGQYTGVDWARHEDNDCDYTGDPEREPAISDSDCAKVKGENAYHQDQECGFPGHAGDMDCNGLNGEGGAHSDFDCWSYAVFPDGGWVGSPHADVDCSSVTGDGVERHSDDDCRPGGSGLNGSDSDCGNWGENPSGGHHSDKDCSGTTSDSDCGTSTASGGTHTDNDGIP